MCILKTMKTAEDNILTLGNFEGPIDFLLHLVQKCEIDISDIPLHEITAQYMLRVQQFLTPNIDSGAEFVGTTASLLLLKSKMLLPKHEQTEDVEELAIDPRFEIIHQLIDYCRFKEVAKILKDREDQLGTFPRGVTSIPEAKKPSGVEHLSMNDLAVLFQQVLDKAASYQGEIQEEVWRVTDKMALIRRLLAELQKVKFEVLFSTAQCREELVTTFLAILELMKQGEASIVREIETSIIMIIAAARP